MAYGSRRYATAFLLVPLAVVVALATACGQSKDQTAQSSLPNARLTVFTTVAQSPSVPSTEQVAAANPAQPAAVAAPAAVSYNDPAVSATVSGALAIEALDVPATLIERFSYSYGYLVMEAALRQLKEIDSDYFIRGMLDYVLERPLFFNREQMNNVLFEYQDKLITDAAARLAELAQKNLEDAEQFLAVNGARPTVVATESGLQYEVIKPSGGLKPKETDTVKVNYTLTYLDGRIGDASATGVPSTFALPGMVAGFREGLMLMPVGAVYRFFVHPKLGYGASGSVNIEPNTLLIFDVELIEIVKR